VILLFVEGQNVQQAVASLQQIGLQDVQTIQAGILGDLVALQLPHQTQLGGGSFAHDRQLDVEIPPASFP
jgi:hypothetical protein